jgi:hypothetical protein
VLEDLPLHGGRQATATSKQTVLAIRYLSWSLQHGRPDHGLVLDKLDRTDIVRFITRLAYLERTGEISAKKALRRQHPRSALSQSADRCPTTRRRCAARPCGPRTGRHADRRHRDHPLLGRSPGHAALEEQNNALQNEIQELQAKLQDQEEEPGAAREANCQLMGQLNKSAASDGLDGTAAARQ